LLGEHEKGLADRSMAIGLAPGYALAWEARGNAYYMLGPYPEALADLEEAQKLDPHNQETVKLAAVVKEKADEIAARQKMDQVAVQPQALPPPAAEHAGTAGGVRACSRAVADPPAHRRRSHSPRARP
jgi:tetratricopeptide (TPR) repeat protein